MLRLAAEPKRADHAFTSPLNEGDRAGVGFAPFQSGLLDQKCRDDPMNDLPHRREQQHGPYNLTLKFGEDTFVKIALRPDAKPSDVAARLRKLADEVQALES